MLINDCTSALKTLGPPVCNETIVTEVEVSKPRKPNLAVGLLAGYNDCFFCITDKNKFITKAVSISINYTTYLF